MEAGAAVAARSIYNSPNNYGNQQDTLRYINSPAGYSFATSNGITAVITRTDGAQSFTYRKITAALFS
jgi:hypothetical protein